MSEQTRSAGRTQGPARRREASPWATGFALFAGILMIAAGVYQALVGLAAIFNDGWLVTVDNYAFEYDITAWGWVHLLLGVVVAGAGYGVIKGKLWGRVVGIVLAVLSAISNFMYLPYYPLWSVVIIAIDVLVIWALTVYVRPTEPSR